MKLKKTLSALAASVLMVCNVSAATANAATTSTAASAASIVASVDTRIQLLGGMPMKGDINGDKKVTTEDTAVLEAYINKLVTITPSSRAYNILDVNWDGKLDSNDLRLMPTKNSSVLPYIGSLGLGVSALTLHTGDFNGDGVVNSKDLSKLDSMIKNIESASKYNLALYDPHGYTDLFFISRQYDLNGDNVVNSKDYDALKKYISFFPSSIIIGVL